MKNKYLKLAQMVLLTAVSILLVSAFFYYASLSFGNIEISQFDENNNSVTGEVVQVVSGSIVVQDFAGDEIMLTFDESSMIEKMDPADRFLKTISWSEIETGARAGVMYDTISGINVVKKFSLYPPYVIFGSVKQVNSDNFILTANAIDYVVKVGENTRMVRILRDGEIQYGVKVSELKSGDVVDVTSDYNADRATNFFTAASINIINY